MCQPELLAPAGNWECVKAAVANGADAVYFGLPRFNARLRADNFTEADLPRLTDYLRARGVRAYVTLNTLIFSDELADAERFLMLLADSHVDAVIVQDLGLARLAREVAPSLAVHASTQMTLTSPEGVEFAKKLGVARAVLARELSLRELEKFHGAAILPLEVFVHGALCVAYSGQCLTSEAFGQRSANRGECAQACRLPYTLTVDGASKDLGDRRYLLSPQDLAAVREVPLLMRLGVASFKIEGRLKSPEYVAAVTQVYRQAIDGEISRRDAEPQSLLDKKNSAPPRLCANQTDFYQLEMAFSRGLFTGWLHGVDHQRLVHARFGKKRGAFAGQVSAVGRDHVTVSGGVAVRPGDGVVFDTGGDPDNEQGGRVYQADGGRLFFAHGKIDFSQVKAGDRVWKTDDPQLDRELRNSFRHDPPATGAVLVLTVSGAANSPLSVTARLGDATVSLQSQIPLQCAQKQPLTVERLREQLGRLGGTRYRLGPLTVNGLDHVMLPVSELNRLRREMVARLDAAPSAAPVAAGSRPRLKELLAQSHGAAESDSVQKTPRLRVSARDLPLTLSVTCRTNEQIDAALACGVPRLYLDFEDLRRYRDAVTHIRATVSGAEIFLATPRIQKAGEQGLFQLIASAAPDGVLIRNLGALSWFQDSPLRKVGDFSLNVANPLTADLLKRENLETLTMSYDLNAGQVLALLAAAPPAWFELTLHQHLPMFHMEHCVFAAFLSTGSDSRTCGRPCERHTVRLRDRVGAEHPVKADVGCRNTVFHQRAQSGAAFYEQFQRAGLRRYRVELLDENAADARVIISVYQALLAREITADELVAKLKVAAQLGVTSGTLTVLA
ncbi:MAG: U32 family peptidase [Verrucomicrobiales bacterium]|jgi:putative protease|nr:U32 family peptidase [Verrucomicrobiales bacterium]